MLPMITFLFILNSVEMKYKLFLLDIIMIVIISHKIRKYILWQKRSGTHHIEMLIISESLPVILYELVNERIAPIRYSCEVSRISPFLILFIVVFWIRRSNAVHFFFIIFL